MTPIVLDASVAVTLVRKEEHSDRWRSLIAEWRRAGRRVVVPGHFWLEVVNPFVTRHRRLGEEVYEALHVLDDVVSETVEIGRGTLLLATDHAERFGLTVYDAAYLALAETMDADLATADEALRRAAPERLADRPRHLLSEERARYGTERAVTWPDYSGAASYLASLRAQLLEPSGR